MLKFCEITATEVVGMLLSFEPSPGDCSNRCPDWGDLALVIDRCPAFRSRILALTSADGRTGWAKEARSGPGQRCRHSAGSPCGIGRGGRC
jgi:hypothetical protein